MLSEPQLTTKDWSIEFSAHNQARVINRLTHNGAFGDIISQRKVTRESETKEWLHQGPAKDDPTLSRASCRRDGKSSRAKRSLRITHRGSQLSSTLIAMGYRQKELVCKRARSTEASAAGERLLSLWRSVTGRRFKECIRKAMKFPGVVDDFERRVHRTQRREPERQVCIRCVRAAGGKAQ
jgi:hypothetical protein